MISKDKDDKLIDVTVFKDAWSGIENRTFGGDKIYYQVKG